MSGEVDLTDVITVLGYLFLEFPAPNCLDAMDTNDTGEVDISDAISTIFYLYTGGPTPPNPGPETCGTDPTEDPLPPCIAGCAVSQE